LFVLNKGAKMKRNRVLFAIGVIIFLLPAFSSLAAPGKFTPDQKKYTANSNEKELYAPDHILVKFTKAALKNSSLKLCRQRGMEVPSGKTGISSIDALSRKFKALKISRAFIQPKNRTEATRLGVERWFIIYLPEGTDIQNVVKNYSNDPNVEYANPDYYAFPDAVPNDTLYSKHWGHNNTGQLPSYDWASQSYTGDPVGTVGFDANAQAAWDGSQGYGSSDVIIAILDTGVDLDHPDLASNLIDGYDFGEYDSNPNPDPNPSDNGHGTCCAGIAAAIANNSIGACGIAAGCKVMPVKVQTDAGQWPYSSISNSIYYAADSAAAVISMSFGGYFSDEGIDEAIEYAYNEGAVLLAATGNDNLGVLHYPASNQYVIGVGAASPCGDRKRSSSDPMECQGRYPDPHGYTCEGARWWGSNFGTNSPDAPGAVDVLAPTILPTTDIVGSDGYDSGSYYLFFGGTSCSTPYAAGVCALIKSVHPTWTPSQVRNQLTATAIDIVNVESVTGWDRYSGYGMVDAAAAVAGGTGTAPIAAFSGSPTSGDYPLEVDFTDESSNNPTSWSWTFGDGGTSTSQNPTHTYTSTGTYAVSLTATNAYGSDTMTKPYYIVVSPDSLFESPVNYSAGNDPRSVITNDFNEDGDADIAVANRISGNVSILLGDGDGTFATAANYNAGTYPTSVTSGDFDGDEVIDLAVANSGSDNISILLGNGNGTFGSASNFSTGDGPYSIISGDFNGDEDVDLAVVCMDVDMLYIYSGDGDGTFTFADYYLTGDRPFSVTSGDFNDDDDIDLAVAVSGGLLSKIYVYKGNGDCSFTYEQNYNAGKWPEGVTSADFNDDGYDDLAAANNSSDQVSVLKRYIGLIFFADNYSVGSVPRSVTTGDFDDDGDIDIAAANSGSDDVSILLGNGDATFVSAGTYSAADEPHSITTGDFDNDGDTDLAVANSSSDNVSILINVGAVPAIDSVALADDYLVVCPEGDGEPLQVIVDFLDNSMTNTIASNEIWIQVPDDENVSFFGCGEKIYADSAATEENGWYTTITWEYIGGYYRDPLSVGLFDEIIAETDTVTVKSPDYNADGSVNISDYTFFGATYNKCEGHGSYNQWLDFIINSSPSCVDLSDFSVLGEHYNHSYPAFSPGYILASGDVTEVELELTEIPFDDGMLEVNLNLASIESYRALTILLRTEDYQLVKWNSDGSNAIQLEQDGKRCVFISSFADEEHTGGCSPNGTLTLRRDAKKSAGPESKTLSGTTSSISLVGGELLKHDGEIVRIAGTEHEKAAPVYINHLANNYPNPFNPTTTIEYSIKEKAHVSLKIYNVAGQLVKTLVNQAQDRTSHHYSVQWSGRDNKGNPVASGVYFYRLVTKGFTQTKKMVLLK
jgi:subtilisin family serine protease